MPMNKKYIVRLTAEQRAILEQRTRTGTTAASVQRHARILLKADAANDGPAWHDSAIAAALDVSVPTVERVRARFVQIGLDGALHRKPTTRRSQRKLDGLQEAQLVAITCSPPPEGADRWTLGLLADKLVELKVVDAIARDTVRLTLKKTNSSRG
jgi:transposase